MFWKYISALSTHEEVNLGNIIALKEDVLVLQVEVRPKHGAHPGDETVRAVVQEEDLAVSLLVDEHGHFYFKALRQLVNELV